jgi:polyisoprenoid-binding protein YceI
MTKRFVLATALLTLAAPFTLAQGSTNWSGDPAHSQVSFAVRHMGISNVHGRFGNVTSTVVLNDADVSKSSVTATIDVAGIDTGQSQRDNDLKSASFFDVAKFPSATFSSTAVTKSAGGFTITGNLTLHGVTKPVTLAVESFGAPMQSPMDHKMHSGFEATATISRIDFGIGTNYPAAMIGDEVKLTIELEAVKQ